MEAKKNYLNITPVKYIIRNKNLRSCSTNVVASPFCEVTDGLPTILNVFSLAQEQFSKPIVYQPTISKQPVGFINHYDALTNTTFNGNKHLDSLSITEGSSVSGPKKTIKHMLPEKSLLSSTFTIVPHKICYNTIPLQVSSSAVSQLPLIATNANNGYNINHNNSYSGEASIHGVRSIVSKIDTQGKSDSVKKYYRKETEFPTKEYDSTDSDNIKLDEAKLIARSLFHECTEDLDDGSSDEEAKTCDASKDIPVFDIQLTDYSNLASNIIEKETKFLPQKYKSLKIVHSMRNYSIIESKSDNSLNENLDEEMEEIDDLNDPEYIPAEDAHITASSNSCSSDISDVDKDDQLFRKVINHITMKTDQNDKVHVPVCYQNMPLEQNKNSLSLDEQLKTSKTSSASSTSFFKESRQKIVKSVHPPLKTNKLINILPKIQIPTRKLNNILHSPHPLSVPFPIKVIPLFTTTSVTQVCQQTTVSSPRKKYNLRTEKNRLAITSTKVCYTKPKSSTKKPSPKKYINDKSIFLKANPAMDVELSASNPICVQDSFSERKKIEDGKPTSAIPAEQSKNQLTKSMRNQIFVERLMQAFINSSDTTRKNDAELKKLTKFRPKLSVSSQNLLYGPFSVINQSVSKATSKARTTTVNSLENRGPIVIRRISESNSKTAAKASISNPGNKQVVLDHKITCTDNLPVFTKRVKVMNANMNALRVVTKIKQQSQQQQTSIYSRSKVRNVNNQTTGCSTATVLKRGLEAKVTMKQQKTVFSNSSKITLITTTTQPSLSTTSTKTTATATTLNKHFLMPLGTEVQSVPMIKKENSMDRSTIIGIFSIAKSEVSPRNSPCPTTIDLIPSNYHSCSIANTSHSLRTDTQVQPKTSTCMFSVGNEGKIVKVKEETEMDEYSQTSYGKGMELDHNTNKSLSNLDKSIPNDEIPIAKANNSKTKLSIVKVGAEKSEVASNDTQVTKPNFQTTIINRAFNSDIQSSTCNIRTVTPKLNYVERRIVPFPTELIYNNDNPPSIQTISCRNVNLPTGKTQYIGNKVVQSLSTVQTINNQTDTYSTNQPLSSITSTYLKESGKTSLATSPCTNFFSTNSKNNQIANAVNRTVPTYEVKSSGQTSVQKPKRSGLHLHKPLNLSIPIMKNSVHKQPPTIQQPSTTVIPITLGKRKELFSWISKKRKRPNFIPKSSDPMFTQLLGMEQCLHELNGNYFNKSRCIGGKDFCRNLLTKKNYASKNIDQERRNCIENIVELIPPEEITEQSLSVVQNDGNKPTVCSMVLESTNNECNICSGLESNHSDTATTNNCSSYFLDSDLSSSHNDNINCLQLNTMHVDAEKKEKPSGELCSNSLKRKLSSASPNGEEVQKHKKSGNCGNNMSQGTTEKKFDNRTKRFETQLDANILIPDRKVLSPRKWNPIVLVERLEPAKYLNIIA